MLAMIKGRAAVPIGTEEELERCEAEHIELFDYDIITAKKELVFDGYEWLVPRPEIGPKQGIDEGMRDALKAFAALMDESISPALALIPRALRAPIQAKVDKVHEAMEEI